MAKLTIPVLAAILVGGAAVVLLQQREIKRLTAESAALRDEIAQAASLRDENERLATQLKASANDSETGQQELLRLRAQSTKLRQLEQENAQLKAERQAQQAAAAEQQRQASPPTDVKATTAAPPAPAIDLGMLAVADGVAAHFDLGGGTNCVVTPTALPDGNVAIQISLALTKPDGTASELGRGRITAPFGQYCSISIGDRMIAVGVKPRTE